MPSCTLLFLSIILNRYILQAHEAREKVNALTLEVEGFAGFHVRELQNHGWAIFI
jgi:hypothetical protein